MMRGLDVGSFSVVGSRFCVPLSGESGGGKLQIGVASDHDPPVVWFTDWSSLLCRCRRHLLGAVVVLSVLRRPLLLPG